MKKNWHKIALILLVLFCANSLTHSQESNSWCHYDFIKSYETKKVDNNQLIEIPFNIVLFGGEDLYPNGDQFIYDQIDTLNRILQEIDLEFFVCGSVEIVEEYSLDTFDVIIDTGFIKQYDLTKSVNMYVFPYLSNSSSGERNMICGYGRANTFLENYQVFLDVDCINFSDYILPHEVGHIFFLQHTHSTHNGKEYVDRTNCHIVSDEFCDTPADPGLSSSNVNSDCEYFGQEIDPKGKMYEPDVGNIMSYAPFRCLNHFSPEQYVLMRSNAVTYMENNFNCEVSSIQEVNNIGVEVFPNPTDTYFIIRKPNEIKTYCYRIYDFNGRLIQNGDDVSFSEEKIHLSDFDPGVYLIHLIIDGRDTRFKYITKM